MAEQYDIAFLGGLPLEAKIREDMDAGKPTVIADPMGETTAVYRQIARRVVAKLSLKDKDYSQAFPKIVIQNT